MANPGLVSCYRNDECDVRHFSGSAVVGVAQG